jgi:hypothetical protein
MRDFESPITGLITGFAPEIYERKDGCVIERAESTPCPNMESMQGARAAHITKDQANLPR